LEIKLQWIEYFWFRIMNKYNELDQGWSEAGSTRQEVLILEVEFFLRIKTYFALPTFFFQPIQISIFAKHELI